MRTGSPAVWASIQVIILQNRIAIPPALCQCRRFFDRPALSLKNPGEERFFRFPGVLSSALPSFTVQRPDEIGYFDVFARFLSSTFIITRIAPTKHP
jgi:hypothetical protein